MEQVHSGICEIGLLQRPTASRQHLPPVASHSKGPVMKSCDDVVDVSLGKLFNKQLSNQWFDSMALMWFHCNDATMLQADLPAGTGIHNAFRATRLSILPQDISWDTNKRLKTTECYTIFRMTTSVRWS